MLKVLKNHNFSKLFWAGLTSQLGSFVTETALMLYVFALTNDDKSILGLSKGSFLLFLTIGSLIGGPIGAKYNRKKILIFCEIMRIPFVISLFFLNDPYLIICVNALIAFFTGIFNPSRQTLINELTNKDEIQAANSIFASSLAVIHMIGPFIGAWLFASFNGVREILSFDLFTYFLGIFLISKIHYFIDHDENEIQSTFFFDLKEGFQYVNRRRDLFTILICVMLTGFCIGVLIPLLLPFTKEFLASDEKTYGTIMGFFGLGGILGAPVYQYISRHLSNARIILLGFLVEPLIMIMWTRVASPYFSMAIIFFWGVSVFARLPAQLTFLSNSVEVKMLSRVHSLLDLSFVIPNILGSIFITFIGNRYSAQEILALVSLAFFLLIYPGLFFPGMQSLWKIKKSLTSN